MIVELYGLAMKVTGVGVHLWSPWRGSHLEHRLFEAAKAVPGVKFEAPPDELRLEITDAKQWTAALLNIERVLKGWEEEASDAGTDRRSWRWLLEADADAHGFDVKGEKACFWGFLRLSLDRGSPGDEEKGEDIDLNGFGLSFYREEG